jgi:TonB family protein
MIRMEAYATSRFRARVQEKSYLSWAFAASACLHGLVYFLGYAAPRPAHPPVELDLTMSGHVGMLGGGHHAAPRPAAPPPAPKAPEKEWVKPAANQAAPVPSPAAAPSAAPAPEEDKPAASANQSGPDNGGFGEGDGDLSSLTRLPAILNLGDLAAILRKFYPEAERDAGREGVVVVDLHVGVDGRVASVDVVRSVDPAFDEAARRVGLLLRFSPAYRGAEKVPVKLRQAIKFNLEK